MNQHETINYLEFPSSNFEATQHFFSAVFNWSFESYGPEYLAFKSPTLEGGFYASTLHSSTKNGASLVVFYSKNLEETQEKIVHHKGIISQEIFSFPGGRRFHFTDPSKNEFAIWSDV